MGRILLPPRHPSLSCKFFRKVFSMVLFCGQMKPQYWYPFMAILSGWAEPKYIYCILHQQWSCLVLLKMTFLWTSICSTNRIYSPLELLTLVTSYLNIDRCRSLNSSQDKPEEMSKHAWLHFWPRLSGFQMQCFKKINKSGKPWLDSWHIFHHSSAVWIKDLKIINKNHCDHPQVETDDKNDL